MEKQKDYRSAKLLAKGAGLVFIGLLIGRLLGYATRLVVARYLGPSEYGILILALSVFSIVSVVGLIGLQGGLLRFVPEFAGKNQSKKIRPAAYYSAKIALPISAALMLVIFFSSEFLAVNVFRDPQLMPVLQIISLAIPFGVLGSIFLGVIMGLKYPKYRVYVDDVAKPLSRLLLVAGAILLGLGISGASIAYFLSFLISFFLGLYFFLKITSKEHESLVKEEKKELLKYSWPVMFASVIFIIMGQIDSIMLGLFRVASDVGVYNAALPTVEVIVIIPVAAMSLFLPVIAELSAKKGGSEIGRLYKKVVNWILILSIPIFLLSILFPGQILKILFGPEYVAGSAAMAILSIGYFISSVLYPSNDIINLSKKTHFHIYIAILSVTMNIILNYILIPVYGIVGPAIGTSITYTFLGVLTAAIAYKTTGFSPLSRKMLRVLAPAGITFLVFYFVGGFYEIGALGFIILVVPFLAVYGFLLLLFKAFDKEDFAILKTIEEKTGVRVPLVRKILKPG